MDSIQREPDERALSYVYMQVWRHEGLSEQEIAQKLKRTPQAMYMRFKQQGFPICEVCGAYSKEEGHCGGERLMKSTGARRDVPPAVGARELLRGAVERLAAAVEDLDLHREHRQGELFVASEIATGRISLPRDIVPEEKWQALCETYGEDPEAESITVPGSVASAAGGSYYPTEPLTTLIGMYLVSGEPLKPLVEALHPDPASADMGEVRKN